MLLLSRAANNLGLEIFRYNNIASFVQVIRCKWELYDEINYRGTSIALGPGTYDLTGHIGKNTLSSLKPYEPRGVCTVHSDPHFITFDQKRIDFMGICTYTLAKPCNVTVPRLDDFHVMFKGERRGYNHISYTKYLLVNIGNTRFKLDKNRVVFLNGEKMHLPISNSSFTVRLVGANVELWTTFGLKVTFDGNHRATVTVPVKYRNKTRGLCGNWNGKQTDDMTDSKGVVQTNQAALGNSWVVEGQDRICPKEPGTPPKCSKDQQRLIQSSRWCGMLKNGPFTKCHSIVNYQDFETSCHYDLCALGATKKALCKSLEAYADECKREGVSVDWRTWAGCPLPCQPNSEYKFCMSACPNTCREPKAAQACKRPCVEGCQCKPGFVMSGRKCVPRDQCGCTHGGFYRQLGEIWTDNTCRFKYLCKTGNKVITAPLGCRKVDPNSECKLNKGSWGCHCKATFRLINGKCKAEIINPMCPAGYALKIVKGAFMCVLKSR